MKPTVLFGLMKIDIGGAETHAVVLARHLTELGYRVVVASNGGVFERELERIGVKHYLVPMHNTRADCLIRSVLAMRRIVREEGVNIIHAHARIPAFVTSIMGRPPGVRFITTAHSNFQGLRHLTRWGEKTIAISEDVREHLISYFHVDPERITLIPNGIDTSYFSPEAGTPGRGDETGITLVSRLDDGLGEVAVNLITACSALLDRHPGIRLTIVGDGNQRPRVEQAARQCNEERGCRVVNLLGARTDVNRIMASSHLVVGVSRVALEAMACARPVLLAGSQGFGGLLNCHNLDTFARDNFTARTTGRPCSVENLARSLEEFFRQEPEWPSRIGRLFRQRVLERYDSLSMARQVAAVYDEIWKERNR